MDRNSCDSTQPGQTGQFAGKSLVSRAVLLCLSRVRLDRRRRVCGRLRGPQCQSSPPQLPSGTNLDQSDPFHEFMQLQVQCKNGYGGSRIRS